MQNKIVIITPGQPAVNPRVVKEADALTDAGYDVTVLYCFWIQWASDADEVLLKNVKWKYKLIGGSPTKNKGTYYFTRIRLKINNYLNKLGLSRALVAERAQARCYDELLKAAKDAKASLYIGHNLGALAVAANAAKHNKTAAAFDYEDYHRDEKSGMATFEGDRIVCLENKYSSSLSYISASSELIAEKVKEDLRNFQKPVAVIRNCFPLKERRTEMSISSNSLRLFWFSQTIGKRRGLECVIDALELLADSTITLTLAGRLTNDIDDYINSKSELTRNSIHYAGIILPTDLVNLAATFDVGLALETGFSLNNHLALSNKIFTYLLAGNAILFSETKMQKFFNDKYHAGKSFKIGDTAALADNIKRYKDRDELEQQKRHNYKLASESLNWEEESKKLVAVVSSIILN